LPPIHAMRGTLGWVRSSNPRRATRTHRALRLIAARRADAGAARTLYAEIESQRGTASFFVPLTLDRLLGLLAATSGDLEAAAAHFEAGLVFCERAGYEPERGWTAYDYAEALRRRAGPGDDEKAGELEEAARAVARELGMRGLVERLLGRRPSAQP